MAQYHDMHWHGEGIIISYQHTKFQANQMKNGRYMGNSNNTQNRDITRYRDINRYHPRFGKYGGGGYRLAPCKI